MSQFYSDESRGDDDHALPDAEVFHVSASDFLNAEEGSWMADRMDDCGPSVTGEWAGEAARKAAARDLAGWFYWYCFPGCLPDSEPSGPFTTEQEAINDARENG